MHDRELYVYLKVITGFIPKDISLYKEALIHRSANLHTKKGKNRNNERLEFLGDAVLDMAVGEILFRHFPQSNEGFLTSTRSKIVQRDHLNKVAVGLGLNRVVQYNNVGNTHNSFYLGNALEALIGALYLDRGYTAACEFISHRIINQPLEEFANTDNNYKSSILEWTQKRHYDLKFVLTGSNTDKDTNSVIFESAVLVNGIEIAHGMGYTKKESHQVAAREALWKLRNDPELRKKIKNSVPLKETN